MGRVLNLVLAGVGGQGIVSLANVIANAALHRGTNVVVAETHGLSQRGGSVIVHVRLGDAEAPLIPVGEGDIMIALDPLEAARYAHYLKQGALAYVEQKVTPPPLPGVKPPSTEEVVRSLEEAGLRVRVVPAIRRAQELGNPLGANVYMLGAAMASGVFDGYLGPEDVEAAIKLVLKKPEKNIRLFRAALAEG
ncbi:MAG: indolepyruvate oxidoreductase subunit beta [Desulfurococcales archaeon]|nr:indolepyruvate oxidoreductase subunit beta [Desulfurococcales archaeon]